MLRTKLFLRGKTGVEAIWGPPSSAKQADTKIAKDEDFRAPAADLMEFSADGSKVALVSTASGIVVRDTETYVAAVRVCCFQPEH
jgi:hypothetical protein